MHIPEFVYVAVIDDSANQVYLNAANAGRELQPLTVLTATRNIALPAVVSTHRPRPPLVRMRGMISAEPGQCTRSGRLRPCS